MLRTSALKDRVAILLIMLNVQLLSDSIDCVREVRRSAANTARLTTTWRIVMPAPSLED